MNGIPYLKTDAEWIDDIVKIIKYPTPIYFKFFIPYSIKDKTKDERDSIERQLELFRKWIIGETLYSMSFDGKNNKKIICKSRQLAPLENGVILEMYGHYENGVYDSE